MTDLDENGFPKMKPCPFCGTEEALNPEGCLNDDTIALLCLRCGATGPEAKMETPFPTMSEKKEAIKKWNERNGRSEN